MEGEKHSIIFVLKQKLPTAEAKKKKKKTKRGKQCKGKKLFRICVQSEHHE